MANVAALILAIVHAETHKADLLDMWGKTCASVLVAVEWLFTGRELFFGLHSTTSVTMVYFTLKIETLSISNKTEMCSGSIFCHVSMIAMCYSTVCCVEPQT